MSSSGHSQQDAGTPPAINRIVIENKSRGGCFRALVGPLLLVSLLANVILLSARSAGVLPDSLGKKYYAGPITADDEIAIIDLEGTIGDDTSPHVIRQLRQSREDRKVKAAVLRIDSPGGTVVGSDQIWREVALLKATGKPVVVSMGGLAASGGYYVAAPADLILAEPTTTTGSIGVILEVPNFSKLMEKVGVDMNEITAGSWKGAGSPYHPFTDRDRARFQKMVDDTYDRFLRVVAQGRHFSIDQARELADGQVYTAKEAQENGLIDRLGYLEDAIEEARTRAKLERPRIVRYNRPIRFGADFFSLASQWKGLSIDSESLMKLREPRLLMIMR